MNLAWILRVNFCQDEAWNAMDLPWVLHAHDDVIAVDLLWIFCVVLGLQRWRGLGVDFQWIFCFGPPEVAWIRRGFLVDFFCAVAAWIFCGPQTPIKLG